jgi:hypothetical protein
LSDRAQHPALQDLATAIVASGDRKRLHRAGHPPTAAAGSGRWDPEARCLSPKTPHRRAKSLAEVTMGLACS